LCTKIKQKIKITIGIGIGGAKLNIPPFSTNCNILQPLKKEKEKKRQER